MGPNSRSDTVSDVEILEEAKGELAASLSKDFIVLGSPSDVRRYSETVKTNHATMNNEELRRITFFVPLSSSANIVTYTDDTDRIASFISAIVAAKGAPSVLSGPVEPMVAKLPFSATETTLGEQGLERVTRSPLGQFSTLLPLLIPEKSSLMKSSRQTE